MLALCASALVCAGVPSVAAAATWDSGDVFAGVGNGAGNPNGSYNVYSNAGVFKETVSSTTPSSETTACSFDAGGNLFGTHFGAAKVVKWSGTDPHGVLQTIDPTSDHPGTAGTESIVFAANGDFYVGHADGNHDVVKYNSSGVFQTAFDVATDGQRGSDFIDLAADQKTLYYTGEADRIRRYDLSTQTQLADFATVGGQSFALRLLPPGDGSGGMLVAHRQNILRLDGAGNVVNTYTVPGESFFFALNLDPNGTSFWSAGISSLNFYRFNLDSGAVEVGPINTGTTSSLAGLCVKGEPTAAVPPVAPAQQAPQQGAGAPARRKKRRAARRDRRAPRVSVAGISSGCVRTAFTARFRIRDASSLRRASVYLDGKRIARTTRKTFRVRVNAGRLRAGRHRLRVVATDRSGNRRTMTKRFARCAQRAVAPPHFTG